MNLFVYGTLLDDALRRAVIGGGFLQTLSARLNGQRRARLSGTSYPTLRPAAESSVDGLLLMALGRQAAARVAAYEGRSYRRRGVLVETDRGTMSAQVYVAIGSRATRDDWSFSVWQQRSRARDTLSLR